MSVIEAPPARVVLKEEELSKFEGRRVLKMNIRGLIGEAQAV